MLLIHGKAWEDFQRIEELKEVRSFKDFMEFIEEKICTAFAIPPLMLGMSSMTKEEELLQKIREGIAASKELEKILGEKKYIDETMKFVPASSLSEPNNYIKELLEQGSRSEGPFTTEMILQNPRIGRAVRGALSMYDGPDRFASTMKNIFSSGQELSPAQLRAVANIIYKEHRR